VTGYDFHPEAEIDLDEIWEYIAKDGVDAADRVIGEIQRRIEAAVTFPYIGHRRPDLNSRGLRFLHAYDYLIAYAPDERPLWILAVIHGRRDPRMIAAILEGRR
jgi:plasmid stabilization system protein ParE